MTSQFLYRRREFIAGLGSATAWPVAARAQPAMPVIGYLDQRLQEATADRLRGFHRGLKEMGFIEGENVAIVYRWAEGQAERLPELAADLVRRRVTVIASTGGSPSTLAAKAATTTIPIVFLVPEDPVRLGLVSTLARPDRNLTGPSRWVAIRCRGGPLVPVSTTQTKLRRTLQLSTGMLMSGVDRTGMVRRGEALCVGQHCEISS